MAKGKMPPQLLEYLKKALRCRTKKNVKQLSIKLASTKTRKNKKKVNRIVFSSI